MKPTLLPILLLAATLGLAGCGTTYMVKTRSGGAYHAEEQPVTRDGYVTFSDADGNTIRVREAEVEAIIEK